MKRKQRLFRIFALVMVMSMIASPLGLVGAQKAADEFDFSNLDWSTAKLNDQQPFAVADLSPSENGVYIVRLDQAPVASYVGGTNGLAATAPRATGSVQLDANSPAAQAYAGYLEGVQAQFLSSAEGALGRQLKVRHQYLYAINGMALEMSHKEAKILASLPGVAEVEADTVEQIATDVGPTWIGAPGVWDGSGTAYPGTMGEGVIVGVLDTGINMDHPSFAAVGGDGFAHTNPNGAGVFLGWCDPINPNYDPAYVCNDKLIGAWDYADASWGEVLGPEDVDGHGSHTSSTTAGNVVSATLYAPTAAISATISGVAPHANIIIYDVCGDEFDEGCFTSDSVAAINQAIIDGVDVLNESIGIGGDTFTGSKQSAYLGAFDAGIVAARSAGNSGPGAATVGPEPVWTMSTAAMTHNRALFNGVVNMVGGNTPPPADIQGLGFTSAYGPVEIVYAGDYPSGETVTPELCGAGASESFDSPWPGGTFSGEIVVCDRGEYGRVEKGANVLAAGAGGYVLVDNGGGLVSDQHELPGVHITASDGAVLKAWLADGGASHVGSIAGVTVDYSPSNGDTVIGFSSRGPAPVDVLKPDLGAPGVSIWAAVSDNPGGQDEGAEYGFLSGTSMASPHVAGASALMVALHPSWTPAQIRSALMSTSMTDNLKEDMATSANPFDDGAGRIDVTYAANAGLVLNETAANFAAADPNFGGDPTALNLASMADSTCYQTCAFTRTLESVLSVGSDWDASVTMSDPRMDISLSAYDAVLSAGESFTLTVDVDVTGVPTERWVFGEVTFSEAGSLAPDMHMPIAVYVQGSTSPLELFKSQSQNHGSLGDVVWYTMTVSNQSVFTDVYNAKDFIPYGLEPVSGTASATTGSILRYGMGDVAPYELEWQGQLAGGELDLLPTGVIIPGYLSLSSLGVTPFGFPSNPDDGCWGIGGLNFEYLGTSYDSAIWSMNGGLEAGLASGFCMSATNASIPSADATNNLLAPWWTDLDMTPGGGGGEIYLASVNVSGFVFTVFEWEDAEQWGDDSSSYSFQIWMYDGTDLMWFTYGHLTGDTSTASVGFEDSNGAVGFEYYYNGAGTLPTPGLTDYEVIATAGETAYINYALEVTEGAPGEVKVNNAALRFALPDSPVIATAWAGLNMSDPSIDYWKTVSEDGSCGDSDSISVANTSDITYCYTLFNTGNMVLDEHKIEDNVLGIVYTGTHAVEPGQMHSVLVTVEISEDTSNTAYWLARNNGVEAAIVYDSAEVFVTHYINLPFVTHD